jgi:PAS domain S-box-containing protein
MDHQPKQTDGSALGAPEGLHSGRYGAAGAFAATELSHYVFAPLRQDEEFLLSRGRPQRHTDGSPASLLALTPVGEYSTPASLRRLEHEYALRAALEPAWAVRPLALTQQQGRPLLVLEDPGGEPLDRFLQEPMQLPQFLRIAIGLAAALSQVHQHGLIHKDLKPAHVLVHSATGQVWLMGFGIASRLPRERQAPEPPEVIAGTLAYMAPEQTGRMNRSLDARSDLYALGVTLYELLTGALPFTASEPLEWVHCHIARRPTSPTEQRCDVPAPLSAIILKLLAKTAEERYQTAAGVEHDLRRCLAHWEAEGCIEAFPLGEHDVPDRLLILEKLYGREREIETLLAAFDRVVRSGTPELVLVSGYAGIGKSSVVNELHKVLVPLRGLFASGKFDQYKRDIPYATLVQALQSLLRPLLGKGEVELAPWRAALQETLGPNARLIVDLVPELKLITGEPPPVPELPPQDAHRRFQLVFRRFLGVFARPEHPLALFLDDLQWLDAATLDLIEDLLTQSDVRHLLLIGAYRDNEVDVSHPLMRKLDAIRHAGAPVQEITLAPLVRDDLMQLIVEALRCEPERAAPLAQLVHEKTGGNPFFTIQFLSTLADEGLLTFNHGQACWVWNLERIHAKRYTENVADLMVGKLTRLPAETQQALRQLACLGNIAEINMLSLVLGSSEAQLHEVLWDAVRLELIERGAVAYRFVHDRVQEAAYSLSAEESRAETHLRIGRLLVSHTPREKREESIFSIVNQLNRGAALITDQDEREQLAEFNLLAGQRAKASAAYTSALTYLVVGAALLPEDCWERRHELAFALELHRAECEFLTGALADAEQRLAVLSARTATTIERASVACLRVDLYTTLGQPTRAVAVGLDYLQHLGIEWSPHPTDEEVRREYDRIWRQLGSRTIEDLIELPVMTDPASLATMEVLTKVLPAAVMEENFHALAVCWAANHSLERGNCDASCDVYVRLGVFIACNKFGDYQAGVRFGNVGCELSARWGWKRFQARTYLNFAHLLLPYAKHVQAARDLLRRGFEIANEIGDLMYMGWYSCFFVTENLFATGSPLREVQSEAERGLAFAQKAQLGHVIDVVQSHLGLVRTLRGVTRTFGSFDDEQFEEAATEARFVNNPNLEVAECWYFIRKLQAHFHAGAYTLAVEAASRAQRHAATVIAILAADFHFYGALARAAACETATASERQQHLQALAAHDQLLEVWAEHCPENFANRAALVAAEIARIEGRDLEAMRLYEAAIRAARANGFIHHEALAHELAARFYAARGFEQIAHLYLRTAHHGYLRWGADGKVKQLEELYPHLREHEPAPSPTSTIGAPVDHLDLAAMVKMSQALSSELVLDQLIETLLRLALQHVGAERGLLLLPHGDTQRVAAEAATSRDTVSVRLLDTPATPAELPDAVLQYVLRTQERVLLEDAAVPHPFSADVYFQQRPTRSILCLPLVEQGHLIGILYLENTLAAHVFTPARTAVLEVLASQAAISLDNARLYTDLQRAEERVRQDEQELRQLLNVVPQHILMMRADGTPLYANQRLLAYHGMTLEDVQMEDFLARLFHPEDRPKLAERQRAIALGTAWEAEVRLRRSDGQYRWFLLYSYPLRNEHGDIIRRYTTATDIEERKQAEEKVQTENLVLREEVSKAIMFEEIVGASPTLQAVLERVAKVAPTDSTVLITGETGTGKELLARAIHKRSARAARAFISVNCAVIPPSLLAAELFGHEKGAFTGAQQRRLGRFELAEGGTLFLDEIGEVPLETQVALLRVLQEREFERVGGTQAIRADVRVIAATNRDLPAAIAAGVFRSDLYYRLNVFPLEAPPLRARQDDIPLLVAYFIERYARKAGKRFPGISQQSVELLQAYSWPGNIRELQNVIERSVIVCEAETFSVDASWLAREAIPQPPRRPRADTAVMGERERIEAALAESRGRVSGPAGAAVKLGMPSPTLESKIKALKINKHRFKHG